jgi:hypothetical protein
MDFLDGIGTWEKPAFAVFEFASLNDFSFVFFDTHGIRKSKSNPDD